MLPSSSQTAARGVDGTLVVVERNDGSNTVTTLAPVLMLHTGAAPPTHHIPRATPTKRTPNLSTYLSSSPPPPLSLLPPSSSFLPRFSSQVYRKFAEERESEGYYEGSIEYWSKSMEAARSAGDRNALGQACYRLGKAYTELEDPTR